MPKDEKDTLSITSWRSNVAVRMFCPTCNGRLFRRRRSNKTEADSMLLQQVQITQEGEH